MISNSTIFTIGLNIHPALKSYLDKIVPQVGDVWRADEVYVKIKGDMKYLFALLDDETRFWISQEVADSKHKHNPYKLFSDGKETTQTRPRVLITDGLRVYENAYRKEFRTQDLEKRTTHIRHIRFKGDMNNNKMERFNGEFRDREKVVRGLKKKDSVMFDGYQIYHNYLRPHESLEEANISRQAIRDILNINIYKPRGYVIIGRSNKTYNQAITTLNDYLNDIRILTYNDLYTKASEFIKRIKIGHN